MGYSPCGHKEQDATEGLTHKEMPGENPSGGWGGAVPCEMQGSEGAEGSRGYAGKQPGPAVTSLGFATQ